MPAWDAIGASRDMKHKRTYNEIQNTRMRLQLIACKVMQKEAYYCAARSKNIIDIVFLPQGLHETPEKLRSWLQQALDNTVDSQDRPYDASLLGYGLCSNGITGLSAKITVVVPRGHDCITLLLGSKEKYRQYFDSHRGVYWYSSGWIEHGNPPGKERYEQTLEEYTEKFGPDNAEYLMQTEQKWINEYRWATYIDWNLPNTEKYKRYTKKCAEYLNWKYDELKADPSLLQRLLDGHWHNGEFLVVKPGRKITEDLTSEGIIDAE